MTPRVKRMVAITKQRLSIKAEPIDGWVPYGTTDDGMVLASKIGDFGTATGVFPATGKWMVAHHVLELGAEFRTLFSQCSDAEIEEFKKLTE